MNWRQKILNKLFGWQYILTTTHGSCGYKTFRATKKWGVWGLKISRKEGWNMLRKEIMAADPPTLLMHGYTKAKYEIISVWWAPLTDELAAAVLMLPDQEVSDESDFRPLGTTTGHLSCASVQLGNTVKINVPTANPNYGNAKQTACLISDG